MEIKDIALNKSDIAAIHNALKADEDPVKLPEEFEDDVPNIHVTLDDDERVALLAGVVAHDYLKSDEAKLRYLPIPTQIHLLHGEDPDRGVVLRMNELEEYALLEAAAWTVHHSEEIIPYTTFMTESHGDFETEQAVAVFHEALMLLSRMITKLETAGVIAPEQQ